MYRNIAIFASGAGSNVGKIIEKSLDSDVKYRVKVVITNNPKSGCIDIAKCNNIPHFVINNDVDITELLLKFNIHIVCLAGYLLKVPDKIINNFYTVNIHPSLLPRHGGKGMYGLNVHRSVLLSGDEETGITIHEVTSRYDEGKILFSEKIPITEFDNENTLQRRVQVLEHRYYPIVIDEICRIDMMI